MNGGAGNALYATSRETAVIGDGDLRHLEHRSPNTNAVDAWVLNLRVVDDQVVLCPAAHHLLQPAAAMPHLANSHEISR